VAAEYWYARSLQRLGDPRAQARLEHVADHHARSYYGAQAADRLGRPRAAPPELVVARTALFPDRLEGPHAERARLLAELGFRRIARMELDAIRGTTADPNLLQAYTSIGASGAALRLAREQAGDTPGAYLHYLYPLAYWQIVDPAAQATALDPLLVEALIRQESLFEPDAVSPADAHGLMQILPRTAREIATGAGLPPPDRQSLHEPAVNVALGTRLLRRLLDRYGGSLVKALAAYNGGEDAVAKWERRHPGRDEDEFVELISYRETRDYVRAVIGGRQTYYRLYAREHR